eukprot:scaffold4661_cov108-Cylindrotheca_fusiformis.AAC.4
MCDCSVADGPDFDPSSSFNFHIVILSLVFFDNEYYNIRQVEKLGVKCIYTPDGMEKIHWQQAKDAFEAKIECGLIKIDVQPRNAIFGATGYVVTSVTERDTLLVEYVDVDIVVILAYDHTHLMCRTRNCQRPQQIWKESMVQEYRSKTWVV